MIVQVTKEGTVLLRMELAEFIEWACFSGIQNSIEKPYRLSVTATQGDDVVILGATCSIDRIIEAEIDDEDDAVELDAAEYLDLPEIEVIDPTDARDRDDQADGSKK